MTIPTRALNVVFQYITLMRKNILFNYNIAKHILCYEDKHNYILINVGINYDVKQLLYSYLKLSMNWNLLKIVV